MPKRESGDLENDWRDWIISHALMTEAQNLLGTRPPKPDSFKPVTK